MDFKNVKIMNFENAFRGMRNPKESYHLSDSFFGIIDIDDDNAQWNIVDNWMNALFNEQEPDLKALKEDYLNSWLSSNSELAHGDTAIEVALIGPNDMRLAQTLIKAGPEHRKFMRQIIVSVDITAPLYWWKEFDTYKVGTVANSTSTMHKIASKPITLECFEIDDFQNDLLVENENGHWYVDMMTNKLIEHLEDLRQAYIRTKNKRYWKELIRWLPESWLQTRTVTMSYENLLAMCSKGQRRFHKLSEWSGAEINDTGFIKFARTLPYAQELIFIDELNTDKLPSIDL